MRVLLIEDDAALCSVLGPVLRREGFCADCAASGPDGLELLRAGGYDVCILDRMLPGLDGLSVLKQARAEGVRIPVLLLTALGRIGDRVDGLDAGADDYLTKPFDTRELLARLRALARRPAELQADERVNCGDLALDVCGGVLYGPGGQTSLSRREADLLALFVRAPGRLRSRAVLLNSVWGPLSEVEEANLDSYIHFVRRRLALVRSGARIVTVRGAGYRLEASDASK